MKQLALSLSLALLSIIGFGQEYPISTPTITDCGAFLVDDGYSANDYTANGNYTTTICSDGTEESNLVNLYFTIFNLGAGDQMKIYDGPNNTDPLIGTYTGSDLQGFDITATNEGGCLTVEFTSDGDANVGNFGCEISCGLPCAKPWAAASTPQEEPIQICVGEEITFDGSPTTFADGRNFQSAVWDFGDESPTSSEWPTTTHAFDEGGAYVVSLLVTDDTGCQNANLIDLLVYVSTTPDFDFVLSSNDECAGTEVDIQATVAPTNWTNVAQADFGGALWVPDSQGACFEHELTYTTFLPGASITDVSQIENISINFEHTYMGDLVITFICPNGQSIVTHQQGGGGTNLGNPVSGTDGTPGEGFDYTWDPDATNGTWAANAGGTLPAGAYESVQPFTNLVGCPLNGTWAIEVCDLWGSDDGYIFDWALNIDPSLNATTISFTPEIISSCEANAWTGDGIASTDPDCQGITVTGTGAGANVYSFEILDNFGCTYSDDVTVNYSSGGGCNAAPSTDDDFAEVDEDESVIIDVLDGDSDFDGELNILSLSIATQPDNGEVQLNEDGTVTYLPDPNFFGNDTFTYSICDSDLVPACASGSVYVTVNPINDEPTVNDDIFGTQEDTAGTFDILANDSDADGSINAVSLNIVSGPENGLLVLNEGGTVTYTPFENYFGTDSFIYEVCDNGTPEPVLCAEATVTIQVESVNDAPSADNETLELLEDNEGTIIDILTGDEDPDGELNISSVEIITAPEHGEITFVGDGTVIFTPDENYFGEDSFTYEVCDSEESALCAIGEVSLTILPINDEPSVNDDLFGTQEDSAGTFDILANDSDVDGSINALSLNITSGPEYGLLVLNEGGTVTYTPFENYFGTDSFTYEVCDNGTPEPVLCAEATVTIEVESVNDAPTADNESVELMEDNEGMVIDILTGDEDIDGELNSASVQIITAPEHGEITFPGDGTVIFTPDENYNGEDSFVYEVCDLGEPELCATGEVVLSILPVNDAPLAMDDFFSVNEGTENALNVVSNDGDIDGNIVIASLEIISQPSNGFASIDENGLINYIPNDNFEGNDLFVYQICDDGSPEPAECSQATVLIFVANTNDAPIAQDDFIATSDQSPITLDLRLNDFDLDGDALLVTSLDDSQASGSCSINEDGTITYYPTLGFCGIDEIPYEVCDNGFPQMCDQAALFVEVYPADSDEDGLSDSFESVEADTDGDEIPDYLDLDSDNDGIPDSLEGQTDNSDPCNIVVIDSDEDGTPDYLDEDSDDDGISDEEEAGDNPENPIDSDGDDQPDYLDDDSDNDGISDEEEAGDDPENPIDSDGDGEPDYTDVDSDNDGISDEEEAGDDPENPIDSDGDGDPDYTDVDSDNDGISDEEEAGDDPENPIDSDGDGDPDYTDVDSDNDGISDEEEAGDDPENPIDSDGDGEPDYTDVDSDNDGISDEEEAGDDPENPIDSDGDGDPDYTDVDSDNDGISDEEEAGDDPENPIDSDGDGDPDYTDVDSDNDGISDEEEAGDDPDNPIDSDGDGEPDYTDVDSDNDGISDEEEAGDDPENPIDSDGDGDPDYTDVDSDNDGISDEEEAGDDPENPIDSDGDGDPDYTDVDSDNDGISDEEEAGDDPENPIDSDGDGDPDYTDVDSDNDGISDEEEAGDDPENPIDSDGDGEPDYTDVDSDNDGIPDEEEAGDDPDNPIDSDGDGIPDYVDVDSDNDGIDDINEDSGGDCDLDGIPNELDTDPCFDSINPPQGFSPNGDNIGDTWVIPGLDGYPNASVTIFNRWGNEVYSSAPYKNDWNGEANRNGDGALPGATYYYVLDLGDGSKPTTGFIYMTRN